jgi:hypothetical protein
MVTNAALGYNKLLHPLRIHVGPHGEMLHIYRIDSAEVIKKDHRRIHELCLILRRNPGDHVAFIVADWVYVPENQRDELQVTEYYRLTSTGIPYPQLIVHRYPGNIGVICGDFDKECFQRRAAGNDNIRNEPNYGRRT